ncbi:MAG: 1-acyl-sn-glycerol-3-phosphate acyltransferase [Firmicutes bacterium]|nr:1-acyl-sn-glycerol-3-phosphate acyltransferase [Bacillota bacterium]MCL2256081.1 1-acyl-sn-glycerol-3-phosphate acyltransferase [Bacillota bacterium]
MHCELRIEIMAFFYYLIKIIFFIPGKILFPVKVVNKKSFPKDRRIILIANHLSWWDIVILGASLPGFRRYLAKKELGKGFLSRLFLGALGGIFIDREKPDISAIRKVKNVLDKGRGIAIFPEGTRNKEDDSLQEIKGGAVMFALQNKAPLVVASIHHKTKPFRKNYIYIDENPLKFDEEKRANVKNIADGTEELQQKMLDAKIKIDEWVASKKDEKTLDDKNQDNN